MNPVRSALLAVLLILLVPAGASAATTIGSAMPSYEGETLECTHPDGCTFVGRTIAGNPVVVPHDGIITSWSAVLPSSADTGAVDLVVLRPNENGAVRVGATPMQAPAVDGTLNRPSATLPVKAGDLIGVELDEGDEIGIASHPGIESSSWWFAPRLAAARAPDLAETDDFQALFNATIQLDADGNGQGDENQSLCLNRRCTVLPELEVSIDQQTVFPGSSIRMRAVVRGPGRRATPDATLTLKLTEQVAAVAATGRGCALSAQEVTCKLGRVAVDERLEIDFELRAVRPGAGLLWTVLETGGLKIFPRWPREVRILATERCSNALPRATIAGDLINGGRGPDTLTGLAGDDCIFGHSGGDSLSGGDGDDRLDGGVGHDLLRGGAGNDRLSGGTGVDRLDGGTGNDVIDAVDRKRDVVRCGSGRDRARADAADSVAGCEAVRRVPRAKRRR